MTADLTNGEKQGNEKGFPETEWLGCLSPVSPCGCGSCLVAHNWQEVLVSASAEEKDLVSFLIAGRLSGMTLSDSGD